MELGTTFSHLQASTLGQNPRQSYLRILKLPIQHVRLCVYWPEIQPEPDQWNFNELHWYLRHAKAAKKQVTIACGQKSPRWPEFHLPSWLPTDLDSAPAPLFSYLRRLMTELKKYDCIVAWQIENEPFDPSGPEQRVINQSLFAAEVSLARSLDDRPVVSTVWGNTLLTRKSLDQLLPLVDQIGIDLYPTISSNLPSPLPRYHHQWLPGWLIKKKIKQSSKPIYIAELQAEPWEVNQAAFLSRQQQSISPQQLRKNILFAQSLGIQKLDLWGAEYWLFATDHLNQDYASVINEFSR